jgi:hypothetical protein
LHLQVLLLPSEWGEGRIACLVYSPDQSGVSVLNLPTSTTGWLILKASLKDKETISPRASSASDATVLCSAWQATQKASFMET